MSSARLILQPGDQFSGPLFSRGGNNAVRNPDNRVALFRFPRADAALRAVLAEKFFGQFFTVETLPPPTIATVFQAKAPARRKLRARVRFVSGRKRAGGMIGWRAGFAGRQIRDKRIASSSLQPVCRTGRFAGGTSPSRRFDSRSFHHVTAIATDPAMKPRLISQSARALPEERRVFWRACDVSEKQPTLPSTSATVTRPVSSGGAAVSPVSSRISCSLRVSRCFALRPRSFRLFLFPCLSYLSCPYLFRPRLTWRLKPVR